ncbi:peroxisomal membrane protein PEX13 [Sabethes cyaneus]|uniref:peroxisomal membrane protein PEX13 n=1 Tax=Sabethes cyaneus TaxID=53552 RepID=UPI00221E298A|nr:peroxisomal membrane protein PEX13 [Sabethes cyaneus]
MQPVNFRSPILNEPRIFGGEYSLNTPAGHVATTQPPPLPPRPLQTSSSMYSSNYGNRFGIPSYGYSGLSGGYGGHAMYGNMFMNNMYGNGYGHSAGFPEHRFIQLAEESSRPALQNIESLVGAIGNIASLMDSTFFALTSSFRAVLGVAANFAHLRGLFAQFWTSFALFRWFTWCYKKTLYLLKLTKTDPTLENFTQAFKAAEVNKHVGQSNSSLPIILFLGFVMSAPYLLMKIFGGNEKSVSAINPQSWQNPLEAIAVFNFDSTHPNELTIRAGQPVLIAPKAVQIEHNLLNTGWVLATMDNTTSGLIPINYIQGSKPDVKEANKK